LNCEQHMAESAHLWTEREACGWCDTPAAGHALAVARRVLGTTTGQPATAPWPPTGDQRPDHALYTLLRRAGLTPEAAQQEIDTYTQTILAGQTAPTVDPATVCICGHPVQQHFEDVCQVCDCGDYLEPAEARVVIARWREAALGVRDRRRATVLREGADLIEQALIHSVTPAASQRDEVWDQAVRAAATELRDVADGVAAEAQQPTPAEAEETVAACKCGHPQERHVLLSGTYAQCRHKYPEAGRPKCRCGMYRPQSDAPAS
ncbi:hypothetical protein ACFW9I_03290, partial [[Kitasatospora] papulosa]|uniref:hypothetical protein n=1 Tax=[Kitasatospora] papulosa TaxID=1464011 RepID=UPI0036A15C1E